MSRTGDLPAEDRLAWWRERMAQALCPMDMRVDHLDRFEAEISVVEVGEVRVWPGMAAPMSFHRTPALIRQFDPGTYHVTCMLDGVMEIAQAGRREVHRGGGLFVTDPSRPFDCRNHVTTRIIGVEVPRRLLPLPGGRVEQLLTEGLSWREGVGALLLGLLTRLVRDAATYRPAGLLRLETVVLDLLAAALAERLDAHDRLPPETRSHALALRVQSFIRGHLHDPALTPRSVADAHHISLGHLHRILRALGHDTPAASIRSQRLERARQDLADPAQRAVPVQEIGARWGFTDAAVFSRTFRAVHGVPPRDYRRHTLPTPPPSRDGHRIS
ncbi:helix-turn-helix transcriptional regulator [Streptomyces avicenniae]|uniref:helix-turn-helix transcriptional regulator n=1 Tax=Streptomyces avicenniae TaxID=500153 RepID=UPI00167F1717|nr:AraC family transcriptional regulator [Streptomyces avicenniae]